MAAKVGDVVHFNNGDKTEPAIVVRDNGDGSVGLFGCEGEGNDVKFFAHVPEGEGGMTYSR